MNYPKLQIALYEPRIPQNTGNIARTCAAFSIPLNLIGPLGFSLDDKYLKRAGLDYWPLVKLILHTDYYQFQQTISTQSRIIAFSKLGNTQLDSIQFIEGDILLFGREDTGLPERISSNCHSICSIPMPGGQKQGKINGVRSLNLSSAVAIVLYQAAHKLELL